VSFHLWSGKNRVSLFDRVVLLTLVGLALLTGLLAWRGDRVGVRVVAVSPSESATGVSTRILVRITFSHEIESSSNLPLSLSPPVSGTVRWEGKKLTFLPSAPLAPDTTYTVTLAADLKSRQGRALLRPLTWQFRTGQPRILYVAQDEQNRYQLFVIALEEGQPTQLTREAFGVWDYAVSADGTTIAYAALRKDGESDLWAVGSDGSGRRLLLACPEADCTEAAWSPDGRRLVYTRRDDVLSFPRLWWLDVASGETVPLFQDDQVLGFGACWSPDGQWLSYISPRDPGVRVYNVNDSHSLLIPSQVEAPAVWSPQGDVLLVTDVQWRGASFAVHLLRADLESGRLTNLSGEAEVEDGSPAWSPDGSWIAFARKAHRASMGKQLWLMQPDGSQTHYLTNQPEIHHGSPAWSLDGRYLLFQRYPLTEPDAQPGIWLLEVETGTLREVVTPGGQPAWLP
jgi:Tol biopolymer transport system component